MNKTAIILTGPTGIGKTSLSIHIAKHFGCEIISADSRQFYKELKIGTAAPEEYELSQVRHHLVGNISIRDYYNVFMFEMDSLRILSDLFMKHDQAMVVGGSGMYIDALCNGIDDIPDVDPEIRQQLVNRFENEGIEGIRFDLRKLDPEIIDSIDLQNPKRVLRALEVTLSSGKPYSSFRTNERKERPFKMIKIGLNMEREQLYERINKRVDLMVEAGLIEEARQFIPQKKLNALNTVGYKELFEYFEGTISLDRAIELIKRNSRRYAKRQLSWFSRDEQIKWFHPSEIESVISHIRKYLSR